MPASQSSQLAAPSLEAVPAAHGVQVPLFSPLLFPASQSMHVEAPPGENLPTPQSPQLAAPLLEAVPAGQSEHDVLAAPALYVPATQLKAVPWPVAVVYVPFVAGSHEVDPFLGWK